MRFSKIIFILFLLSAVISYSNLDESSLEISSIYVDNAQFTGNLQINFSESEYISRNTNVNIIINNTQIISEVNHTLDELMLLSDNSANLLKTNHDSTTEVGIFDSVFEYKYILALPVTQFYAAGTSFSVTNNITYQIPVPANSIIFSAEFIVNGTTSNDGVNLSNPIIKTSSDQSSFTTEWSKLGDYNDSETINLNLSKIQSYLDNCQTFDVNDQTKCLIPIKFFATSYGQLKIKSLNITYQSKDINSHNIDFNGLGLILPSNGTYSLQINFLNSTGIFKNIIQPFTVLNNIIANNYDESLTTDFSLVNLNSVSNLTVGKLNIARLNWSGSILDVAGYDLDANIIMSNNYLYLNSSELPVLNTSARITFFNIFYKYSPILTTSIDGVTWQHCTDCNIINYNNVTGTLIFNVSHFSAYTSGGNSQLLINYSGVQKVNQTINFFANYSNSSSSSFITGATCKINFSDSPTIYNMISYANSYNYSRNFTASGDYEYSINCSKIGFENLALTDNITIESLNPLPIPYIKYFNITTNNSTVSNIYGYANTNNVTLTLYVESSTMKSIFIPYANITNYGVSSIYKLDAANATKIWIAKNTLFAEGQYVYFENHEKDNLTGYKIINLSPKIENSNDYYELTLDESIQQGVVVGESLSFTNSSTPKGYFNLDLDLEMNGSNIIKVKINDSFNQKKYSTTYAQVYLDQINPVINISSIKTDYYPINPQIIFNITDNYEINETSIFVNISGTSLEELYAGNTSNYVGSRPVYCSGLINNMTCYINTSLLEGEYNISLFVMDTINNSFTINTSFTVHSLLEIITDVQDIGIETDNSSFYFNWTAVTSPGLVSYEYLFKVYDAGEWINITLLNSTNSTNVTIDVPVEFNQIYYLFVRPVYDYGIGEWSKTDGVMYVDFTYPQCPNGSCVNVTGGKNGFFNTRDISIVLNFSEPESQIIEYEYFISESIDPDTSNYIVQVKKIFSNVTTEYSVPFEYGKKYYVHARAKNNQLLKYSPISEWATSPGITFDDVAPHNGYIDYTGGLFVNTTGTTNTVTINYRSGLDNVSNISTTSLYMATSPIDSINGQCQGFSSFNYYKSLSNQQISIAPYQVNLTSGKCYAFQLRVSDRAGNIAIYPSTTSIISLLIDQTPPSDVFVYIDDDWTTSKDLHATWTTSVDSQTGIGNYFYKVVHSSGSAVKNWTQTEYTEADAYNLNLVNGERYQFVVRSENNIGTPSNNVSSNYIYYFDIVPPEAVTITKVENWTNPLFGYYYDYSNKPNTTIYFKGNETDLSCIYSPFDISYKENPDSSKGEGNCSAISGTNYSCTIPNIPGKDNYTYYISCRDNSNVAQDYNMNTQVNFIKDGFSPQLKLFTPNESVQNGNDSIIVVDNVVKYRFFDSEFIELNYTIIDSSAVDYFINVTDDLNQTIFYEVGFNPLPSTNLSNILSIPVVNISSNQSIITVNITVIDKVNNTNTTIFTFIYENIRPSVDVLIFPNLIITNSSINLTLNATAVTNITVNITRVDKGSLNGTENFTYYNYTVSNNQSSDFFNWSVIDLPALDWFEGVYNIFVEWWNDFFTVSNSTMDYGNYSMNLTFDNAAPNITAPTYNVGKEVMLRFNTPATKSGLNITLIGVNNTNISINVNGTIYNNIKQNNYINYSGTLVYNILSFSIEDFENVSRAIVAVSNSKIIFPINYVKPTNNLYYSEELSLPRNGANLVSFNFTSYDWSTINTKYRVENIDGDILKPSSTISGTKINQSTSYSIAYNAPPDEDNLIFVVTSTDSFGEFTEKKINFSIFLESVSIDNVTYTNETISSDFDLIINTSNALVVGYKLFDSEGNLVRENYTGTKNNLTKSSLDLKETINITGLQGEYVLKIFATNEFYNSVVSQSYPIIIDREVPEIQFVRPTLEDEKRVFFNNSIYHNNRNITITKITNTSVNITVNYTTKVFNIGDSKTFYSNAVNITLNDIFYNKINNSLSSVIIQISDKNTPAIKYPQLIDDLKLYGEETTNQVYRNNANFTFIATDESIKSYYYEIRNSTRLIKNNTGILNNSTSEFTITFANASIGYQKLNITVFVYDLAGHQTNLTKEFYYDASAPTYNQTNLSDYVPANFEIEVNTTNIWEVNITIYNASGVAVAHNLSSQSIDQTIFGEVYNYNLIDGNYTLDIVYSNHFGITNTTSQNFIVDTVAPVIYDVQIPEYAFTSEYLVSFSINDSSSLSRAWYVNSLYSENITALQSGNSFYIEGLSPGILSNITIYTNDSAGNIGNYTFNVTPINRKAWFGTKPTQIADYYSVYDNSNSFYLGGSYDSDGLIINYINTTSDYHYSLITDLYNTNNYSLIYTDMETYNLTNITNGTYKNISFKENFEIYEDVFSYTLVGYSYFNNSGTITLNVINESLLFYNYTSDNVIKVYDLDYEKNINYLINYLGNGNYLIGKYNTTHSYPRNVTYTFYNSTDNKTLLINYNEIINQTNINESIIQYSAYNYSDFISKGYFDLVKLMNLRINDSDLSLATEFNFSMKKYKFDNDFNNLYYVNISDNYLYKYNLLSENATKMNLNMSGKSLENIVVGNDFIIIETTNQNNDEAYYYNFDENYPILIPSGNFKSNLDNNIYILGDEGYKLNYIEIAPYGLSYLDNITAKYNQNYTMNISRYYKEYDYNDTIFNYISGDNITLYLNDTVLTIASDDNFSGSTWFILNISDKAGNYLESENITIEFIQGNQQKVDLIYTDYLTLDYYNLSNNDSIGSYYINQYLSPKDFVLVSNTSLKLEITGRENQKHMFGIDNFTSENISYMNIQYDWNINNYEIIDSNIKLGLDVLTPYTGDRYEVLDIALINIVSDYKGAYYVSFNFSKLSVNDSSKLSMIAYSNHADIKSLEISNKVIFAGENLIITGDVVTIEVNNLSDYSFFVLAKDRAITETAAMCGNGKDEDFNGVDLACDVAPPINSGSQTTPKITSGGSSGGGFVSKVVENCTDKIKNQDETQIDCGGVCGGYWYSNTCNLFAEVVTQPVISQPKDTSLNTGDENADKPTREDIINSIKPNIEIEDNKTSLFPSMGTILTGLLMMLIIGGITAGFVLAKKKSSPIKINSEINQGNFSPQINSGEELFRRTKQQITLDPIEKTIISHVEEEKSENPIIAFVESAIAQNVPISRIKTKLMEQGWPNFDIDLAIKQVNHRKNLKMLADFITQARLKGHSNHAIKTHLVNAKWADHFIEMVLHEVNVVHKDYDKLTQYVSTMLSRGVDKLVIRENLVNVGWPVNTVNKAFGI